MLPTDENFALRAAFEEYLEWRDATPDEVGPCRLGADGLQLAGAIAQEVRALQDTSNVQPISWTDDLVHTPQPSTRCMSAVPTLPVPLSNLFLS